MLAGYLLQASYTTAVSEFAAGHHRSQQTIAGVNRSSIFAVTTTTSSLRTVLFTLFMVGLGFIGMQLSKSRKKSAVRTIDVADTVGTDALITDPGLLKKHSTRKSYHVPATRFTYPSIRVFYRPHPQGDKFPKDPAPLPLLVFIHGLGGSVAQFHPILTSLVNVAPCLAIDLPGCGLSKFEPKSWNAYTTGALVQLLVVAIADHREENQGVILIGHSMGCSLAAALASPTSTYSLSTSEHVIGLIAICPKAEPPSAEEVAKFRKLLWIPGFIFNLWRLWDRRGGTESASVKRFTGPDAEHETKKLQVRFNEQSKTAVWRRMASGILPNYTDGVPAGGIPGRDVWGGIKVPVFLIAGEADHVTPASEVAKIASFMGKEVPAVEEVVKADVVPDAAAPLDAGMAEDRTRHNSEATLVQSVQNGTADLKSSESRKASAAFKITILPSPAAHALLYAPTTARTIAGLIQSFLATHINERLSLGWQLQYLTTEGKWDVKNLQKWKAVNPVSEPIAGVFRAMKTLREVDEVHCPNRFVKTWRGKIRAVVDISHESPVYDPNGLEKGGIEYHKFPTVSKLPPTVDEVKAFMDLIDKLRSEAPAAPEGQEQPLIGVHCHYGFNRTGFFLVSYMVEKEGYRLQDAIDEFAKQRPPGIRHEHFIDTLFVRYCVGLKRAPTL